MNLITVLLLVLSMLGQTMQSFASNSMQMTDNSESSMQMDHSMHTMDKSSQQKMTMDCCDNVNDCDCDCPPESCSISSGSSGVLLNHSTTVQQLSVTSHAIDLYRPQSTAFIISSLYRPPIAL